MIEEIEESLIVKAKQGSQDASARLARLFIPILYRYFLRAWRVSRLEAEELTQDTFVEIWSGLRSCDGQAWRGWVMTIARRVAWKKFRAKTPPIHYGGSEEDESFLQTPHPSPNQEQLLLFRDQYDKLRELLPKLRDEYQEILHFYYMEELTTTELAQAMGLPHGTAKTWLQRARRELRKLWQKENKTLQ